MAGSSPKQTPMDHFYDAPVCPCSRTLFVSQRCSVLTNTRRRTLSTASVSLAGRDRGDAARLFVAGTLVAVLDIGYAALLWVVVLKVLTPVQLLQSIAAGVLGKATYAGGLATAALGAVLHFTIAYGWTAVYLVAYRTSPALRRLVRANQGAVKVGLGFGILVWLVMDLVVLPLSRANPTPVLSGRFALNLVAHAVLVGLPIVWLVRKDATL